MNYQNIIENRLSKLITNLSIDFSIDKLSKSPARFNSAKLDWFNKEYLKMMNLQEFCYRATQLKIDKKYKEVKLSPQSSVLIVDFEAQKIFISQTIPSSFDAQDELGTATKIISQEMIIKSKENNSFNYIDSLAMATVWENANAKTDFDQKKFLKICQIQTLENYQEFDLQNRQKIGEIYDGFETTCLVYPEKCENLEEYCFKIGGEFENYTVLRRWINLDEIIAKNSFLTYPIWNNFCKSHNLPCFQPSLEILTQYLAHNLDKNRVTKLSEVG